jgi:signal transduction histidine kinase
LSSAFEELRRDVHDALATVRQLAWEVYPALLLDRGLVPALRAVAADLEATAVGRHDRDVEAAVYFSCVAVLAQAPAARATVRLEEDADALACEIHLDGALLEPLAGVVDRIAAVGGATTFTPSSMRAVIPLPPGRG